MNIYIRRIYKMRFWERLLMSWSLFAILILVTVVLYLLVVARLPEEPLSPGSYEGQLHENLDDGSLYRFEDGEWKRLCPCPEDR